MGSAGSPGGRKKSSRNNGAEADPAAIRRQLEQAEEELRELREELNRSQNREKQTAEQLRMSAVMFRSLSDSSPFGIFVTSPDGRCIHVNSSYESITGLSYQQALGDGWSAAVHPDDRDSVNEEWYTTARLQQNYSSRIRFIKPDGTVIHTSVRATPMIENDEVIGYIGSLEDSTDLELTREELIKSEELLSATSVMAHVGGWQLDLQTSRRMWTDQVYHIYELETGTIPDFKDVLMFYPQEARSMLLQASDRAIMYGEPYDLELPIITAKGNKRWVHTIGRAHVANGKVVRIYGAVQDISDRKKIEDDLRESKERFELAMNGSRDGYWDWRLDTDETFYSARFRELIGAPIDMAAAAVSEFWQQRLHPDDKEAFDAALDEHFKNEVPFSIEHRLLDNDGNYRWFLSRGQAIRGADGKPVRLSGSYTDITRRRAAEEEVRSQSQILDGIHSSMPVFTYRIDERGVFVEMRGRGLRRFGVDTDTLVGRQAALAFPPMRHTVREAMEGRVAIGEYTGQWQGEMWCFVNYIFPDNLRPGCLIGFALDKTERRRAEETVAEKLAILRAVIESTSSTIFAVDREYRYLAFNSIHRTNMRALFGADVEVGMNVLEPFSDIERNTLKAALDRALNNEQFVSVEEHRSSQASEPTYYELSYNPILTDTGSVLGVAVYIQDISTRLRDQKKLFDTLALQGAILDSTHFSIIATDKQGIIRTFNKGAERMLQYSAEEVVGQLTPEIIHDRNEIARRARELTAELGRPVPPGLEAFVVLANMGIVDEREWTFIRKDGSRFPVILSIAALFDPDGEAVGFLGLAVDITRLKEAEHLLVKTQTALLEAQRIARTGSYEHNVLTGKTLWTEQAAVVFGLDSGTAMADTDLSQLIHPDDRESVRLAWQHAIATRTIFNLDYRVVQPNGAVVYVNGWGQPVFSEAGELLFMIGTLQDISIRKQYERDLLAAKEAADKANRAKSEFLANMSHEIRTPLNAVLGFAELLRTHVQEEQPKSHVQAVITSGKTLLTLINDILDLSKIEAGMVDIHAEQADVTTIIADIRQVFSERIREKDLKLFVENPAHINFVLDPGRLRQILLNLVGNAVKFTDSGHIRISAMVREHSGVRRELLISVEDTGIGIPLYQQSAIFEAFRQQDGQSTRKYGGTGLGLTITKRLVEAMNGAISVRSEVGKGATFEVIIPEAASSPEDNALLYDSNSDVMLDFHNATVLIADDDSMNRRLLREMLAHTHLRLIETTSGIDAVRLAWNVLPRLILMDLRMPGIDGSETVERIRKIPGLEDVPVVLLTASALREEAKSLGSLVHKVLYKPVGRAELFSVLMEILPYTIVERPQVVQPEEIAELDESENSTDMQSVLREVSEKLPAVLEELQRDFVSLWRDLTAVPVLDELEDFARSLQRLGERTEVSVLTSYAETLLRQVRSLDIVAFTATLAEFAPLVETIKDIITNTDISSGDTQ